MGVRRGGIAALVLVVSLVGHARAARAAEDWNDAQIAWRPYADGLALAKKERKPICLVFFTEWCPHCQHYSGVFHDPKVVAESKQFVMIRLDKDKNAELSKQYAPDGEYIPRTLFLSSAGVVAAEIHAPRERYLYFYDEQNPASLLAGMAQAAKALR
ncbi:MAG TPA: thioredoxin family protein [Candidatus Binatia bacterium]|nr:thioredoxin family protein [Candidatus Binatia bacterium]